MNVTTALRHRAAATNNLRVANTDMPEQNGGSVIIKYLHNVVVNERLRNAYVFEINGDIRYVTDNHTVWYKGYFHAPNEVILQFPSLPYTDLFDPGAIIRGRRVANIDDPHDVDANAEAMLRHALLANEDRQLTTVCFQLARDLDNNVFSPGQPDNRIEVRLIPDMQPNTTPAHVKVYFTIAIAD